MTEQVTPQQVMARLVEEAMSEPDWHGWSTSGMQVHVGRLPGRKQVCLYEIKHHDPHGASIHPLAYFKNEQDAERALRFLDALVAVDPCYEISP